MNTITIRQPVAVKSGPSLYRLSVAQYHEMINAGILRSGDKVELLEGHLVEKMPHNPPHASSITALQVVLLPRLPEGWMIRQQLPITTRDSEPEPDCVVVVAPWQRYSERHPALSDIALVVEVADTTLEEDRTTKQRIYARARLPIYWIVNIPDRQIEVYTQPRSGRNPTYRQRRDYLPGEKIPLVIAGQEVGSIAVEDLLP
jgi:Uma2 family endonuclease